MSGDLVAETERMNAGDAWCFCGVYYVHPRDQQVVDEARVGAGSACVVRWLV